MADLGEIEDALDVIIKAGTVRENITVLHCNTEYPTPFKDVNLRAMLTIRAAFPGVQVGYSDHTLGIEVPIAAVAMGATVIEKHFTLDKNMEGPDHKASLEPAEFKEMVKAIRNIEKALGNGTKKPSPSELKNKSVARKSIFAARDIKEGEELTEENLTTKRPGTGISPMRWNEMIGRKAGKDYKTDEIINL
jgi:N,N'-diacetyllegionaminate synthase